MTLTSTIFDRPFGSRVTKFRNLALGDRLLLFIFLAACAATSVGSPLSFSVSFHQIVTSPSSFYYGHLSSF